MSIGRSSSINKIQSLEGRTICHPIPTPALRTASSNSGKPVARSGSETKKPHPANGTRTENPDCGLPKNKLVSSTSVIKPGDETTTPSNTMLRQRFLWEFIHSLKNTKASSDELMFCSVVDSLGITRAIYLAAKFHWKCQRPLRALLGGKNGRDRNYGARSAKRKRLSGSPSVSRKRSSGA